MPDAVYQNLNLIFKSLGINARSVTDTLPEGAYLNLKNCEELAENAVSNRLGTNIINRTSNTCLPLDGPVHSLAKLTSLNGNAYRYAGALGNIYVRPASGLGPYSNIYAFASGQPWQAQTYGATEFTSLPYLFIADAGAMLKHNGTGLPQQMGIFQPQFPVEAAVQGPSFAIQFDLFAASFSTSGVTGFAHGVVISPSTTLTSAVTATGVQEVTVAAPEQFLLYQIVEIGSGPSLEAQEVIGVTATGFVAFFHKTHAVGEPVVCRGMIGTVASNGSVSVPFTSKPTANVNMQQADYIALQLFISDPSDIQQIILKFDCGNGTFQSDYFYKVIGQGALQNLLNLSSQPATAATDAIVTEALGVYGNADGALAELNVGKNVWTNLLIQLSDFSGAGRADFDDPNYNWNNINGYQLLIVTNNNAASVDFNMTSIAMVGGAGPDSFAGVGYDYLFTFYNINDGTESNPCMVMTNVKPPLNTNWVYPRRQPVLLTMNLDTSRQLPIAGASQDGQITHIRVYRRGGTLGDNYRRLNTIQVNISAGGTVQYSDTSSDVDIQQSDIISFVNDVPVTSTLPNPVNTTLTAALNPTGPGQALTIHVGDQTGISIGQQVSIGTIGALENNFETVIIVGVRFSGLAAFVQNHHAVGEPVTATAFYGQPLNMMAQAFNQFWFAADPNNPNFLYYSQANRPQYVSSAAYIVIGDPGDPITAVVGFKGNLYVSTQKFWYAVAPGTNGPPTVYPTAAKHGCVAPNGFVATEEAIFYQAIDGIRAFAGGASTYLTQELEFIFQGVGSSPIVEADQTQLDQTRMAYWNNMVFASYIGTDGNRHRVILHTVYKRWRNDEIDAQSMLLEQDTNTLVFGDTGGMVNMDRQNQSVDERNNGGVRLIAGITSSMQTPYSDQGMPAIQKSYQELTLDVNTHGGDVNVFLWFEDGQFSFPIGIVNTATRQKANFRLNNNLGYEFYKVSLQLTSGSPFFLYYYQCSLKYLPLAKTRKTFDTFWLKLGTDESKIVKQIYLEYTSNTTVFFDVYYDGSQVSGFSFSLPSSGGVRTVTRVRLPAVSLRMIRIIGSAVADFQIWDSSKIEMKPLCEGKGWQQIEFVANG